MRLRILMLFCFLSLTLMVFAQASGGQIRRQTERSLPRRNVVKISEPDGHLNGHGYVDLGLPSKTKWATCNVGASKPEESGDFYAWGETEPKTNFSWANYKWNDSVGSTYKSKDLGSNISKKNEYDPAYLNDKNICLPTDVQWQELLDRCVWTYTKVGDRNV